MNERQHPTAAAERAKAYRLRKDLAERMIATHRQVLAADEPANATRLPDRYRGRLSGPLRDRLDLTVEVPALPPDMLGSTVEGESSAAVRERVVAARLRQLERYGAEGPRTNAELTPQLLARHCHLDRDGLRVLSAAVKRLTLSARGYERVRKLAQTIADIEGSDNIRPTMCQALQFRMM